MTVHHEHEPTVYHDGGGPGAAAILGVVAIVVVVILAVMLMTGSVGEAPSDDGQDVPAPSLDIAPPS
jgi:hypothetical protein